MNLHEWTVVTNGKHYRVCNKVTGKFLEEYKYIPFTGAAYLAPKQWSTFEEALVEAARNTWSEV
jgi:hypothetical protein